MIYYNDNKIGTIKNIPTMILTAASIDDVFAIIIFSVFVGMYTTQNTLVVFQLLNIPLAIGLGVVIGIISGFILMKIFNHYHIRNTKKIMLVISIAISFVILERIVKDYLAIASLLGVMALGFYITDKKPSLGEKLAEKLSKIWILVEIFLFVLIGAAVNITVLINTSMIGILIVAVGLIARSVAVYISLISSALSMKEKVFVIFSYLPKATVQAAIGSIPLSLGIPGGEMILAIAVLSVAITAPVGATLITLSSNKLLTPSK
jgi:NhaP-type Na+/H+ or K+/H+ antiporter